MKRVFSVLLALIMVVVILPFGSLYVKALTSGDYEYYINPDNSAMITKCTSTADNIIIPDSLDGHTITEIGESSFRYCTGTKIVVIPDCVSRIDNYAFYTKIDLTTVTIGNSVAFIGDYAFANCGMLKTIYFLGNAPDTSGSSYPFGSDAISLLYIDGNTGFTALSYEYYKPEIFTPLLAPTITPSTTVPTNNTVPVSINYPSDATNKLYMLGISDWLDYTSQIYLSENNTISARYFDIAGKPSNTSKLVISNIDTNAPIVTGVSNNGICNVGTKVTFNEGIAKLDGINFINGTIVSTLGKHTLVVVDLAGNSTILNFTIIRAVTKITLNTNYLKWTIGKSGTFIVTISPSNATNKGVSWKSSNPKVATIDSYGKVKAVGTGTATITCIAKDGCGKTAICKITVYRPVTSVKLNVSSVKLLNSKTGILKVTVLPSNATNKTVSWKSSNTKVATVDGYGKIKTVGAGTATITCTAKDGSGKKTTCKVNVVSLKTQIVVYSNTTGTVRHNYTSFVDLYVHWVNNSSKTVKYVYFYVVPINAVNDVVYDEMDGHSLFIAKETGPFKTGQGNKGYSGTSRKCWQGAWYNSTIRQAIFTKIEIDYMDGTSLTISGKYLKSIFV
jgi:uncharacterized protein YjdB